MDKNRRFKLAEKLKEFSDVLLDDSTSDQKIKLLINETINSFKELEDMNKSKYTLQDIVRTLDNLKDLTTLRHVIGCKDQLNCDTFKDTDVVQLYDDIKTSVMNRKTIHIQYPHRCEIYTKDNLSFETVVTIKYFLKRENFRDKVIEFKVHSVTRGMKILIDVVAALVITRNFLLYTGNIEINSDRIIDRDTSNISYALLFNNIKSKQKETDNNGK